MRKKRIQNEVVETNLPKKEENVLKITKRQRKIQDDKNVNEDDKLVALENTDEEVPKKVTKNSKKKDLDENNENTDLEKLTESNTSIEIKNDDKKTKAKDNKKKTNKESTKKDVQQLEENPIDSAQDSLEKQTGTLTKKVSKRSLRLENKNKLENSEQLKAEIIQETKEVPKEKTRKNSKKEEKIVVNDTNLEDDKTDENLVKPKEKLTKKKSKTNLILEEQNEEPKVTESEKSPKKKIDKSKKTKPESIEETETTETVVKQPKGKKGIKKKKEAELEVEEAKNIEVVSEKSIEEPSEEVEDKKSLKKTKSSSQLPKNKKVKKSEEPEDCEVKSPEKKQKVEMGKKKKSNLKELKIISWNVNGVRACIKNKLMEFINNEDPDIFCLQELKCSESNMPEELKELTGYHCYWFVPSEKDGYSGVAVFSKIEPIKTVNGFNDDEHDKEGRIITCEFEKFYLINVYATNASLKLINLDKKRDWNEKFKDYLNKLDKKKPIIACGDFNCAHQEIDLKNPKTNKKTAGFTPEEREDFGELLDSGFMDSFRFLYPDKTDAYTFWTFRQNSRQKNVGWRLDYFLLSETLKDNLVDNIINDEIIGSDHCPITLLIKMEV